MFPQKESGFLNQLEMLQAWMKEKKKQTALGSSGQSVHGNRAAASTVWQVLLFAETSCKHVKLHRPISPSVTGGSWRPL